MKTLLLLLFVPALLAAPTDPSVTQPVYPATVDGMMRLWGLLYETCAGAKVQPWDVHVGQVTDDGIILKVQDKFFSAFVTEAAKGLGEPLLRLSKFDGQTTANAVFDYELPWVANQPTVLDDQIKALSQNGVKIEKKRIQIIVICAGKPDVIGLLGE